MSTTDTFILIFPFSLPLTMEKTVRRGTSECKTLYETATDLQSRSMRGNILFTGIRETETPDKNCEDVLREFINTKLKINTVNIE